MILRTVIGSRNRKDAGDSQRLFQQQSDLCILQLFKSFLESAPQLLLQLYIILSHGNWISWTGNKEILKLIF